MLLSFLSIASANGCSNEGVKETESSIAAVEAVIEGLDEHVEVVTPSEFMARIKANVKH